MEQMSPKERWLAAINMKSVDRLPFWPKLNGSYPRAQRAPFRDMELDDIHDMAVRRLRSAFFSI